MKTPQIGSTVRILISGGKNHKIKYNKGEIWRITKMCFDFTLWKIQKDNEKDMEVMVCNHLNPYPEAILCGESDEYQCGDWIGNFRTGNFIKIPHSELCTGNELICGEERKFIYKLTEEEIQEEIQKKYHLQNPNDIINTNYLSFHNPVSSIKKIKTKISTFTF